MDFRINHRPSIARRPHRERSPFALLGLYIVIAAFVWLGGCSTKSDSDSQGNSAEQMRDGLNAEQYLKSVFLRYQNARSYRDQGYVELEYTQAGRREVERAPLRTWFDRNQLYVEAYDVRIHIKNAQATAWINDKITDDHDGQVLAYQVQDGRPQLAQLLVDPILNERIAAGLAGPPPQLEWLFSEEPMKRMFNGECLFEFGKPRQLDGEECLVVHVSRDSDLYRFWVHEKSSLIVRVDLPDILLSPESFSRLQSLSTDRFSLSLKLDSATFETPTEQVRTEPLPAQPKYVGRMIPLPPSKPPVPLGKTVRFRSRDQSGRVRFENGRSDRTVTVVGILLDDTKVIQKGYELWQWDQLLPPEISSQVRTIAVTNEKGFRKVPRDNTLPVMIDNRGELSEAIGSKRFELVVLNREGKIMWLEPNCDAMSLGVIGPVLGDVLSGVDVPSRLRDQWRGELATYQGVLAAEISRHQNESRN